MPSKPRSTVHWRHSLRTRIALWSTLVNVVLLVLLTTGIALVARHLILDAASRDTRASAQEAAARLDNAMRAVTITTTGLSDLVAGSHLPPSDLTSTLRALVRATPGSIGGLLVLEPEPGSDAPAFARYIAANGQDRDFIQDGYDYRAQAWFQRTLASPGGWWSEPYFSETAGGTWAVTYNMPLRTAGRGQRTRGMVSLDLPLSYLTDNFESLANLPGWRVTLVAPAGTLAASPFVSVDDNVTLTEYVRRYSRGDLLPMMKAIRLGQPMHALHTDQVTRQQIYSVVEPVGDSGWMLIVGQAYSIVVAHLNRSLGLLVACGLLLLLICMYIVRKLAARISRPVEGLTTSAAALAEGDYESPVPYVRRPDEVGLMARTLEKARLSIREQLVEIEEMGAARQKLESELSIARDIQLAMLPHGREIVRRGTHLEVFAQLEPAKQVGGDFYSFIEGDDDQVWFAIGDVSDKGVPAALFMARTITVLEVATRISTSPAQVLAEASRRLVEGNDTCMFATVLCGRVDPRSGRFVLASAGHEQPLLLDADGHGHYLSVEAGPPLGFEVCSEFPETTGQLDDGQCLFAYTDGVTEAFNVDNEAFGPERLRAALHSGANAEQMCQHVVAKVHAFEHPAPQSDDITALAIRLRRESTAAAPAEEASAC